MSSIHLFVHNLLSQLSPIIFYGIPLTASNHNSKTIKKLSLWSSKNLNSIFLKKPSFHPFHSLLKKYMSQESSLSSLVYLPPLASHFFAQMLIICVFCVLRTRRAAAAPYIFCVLYVFCLSEYIHVGEETEKESLVTFFVLLLRIPLPAPKHFLCLWNRVWPNSWAFCQIAAASCSPPLHSPAWRSQEAARAGGNSTTRSFNFTFIRVALKWW